MGNFSKIPPKFSPYDSMEFPGVPFGIPPVFALDISTRITLVIASRVSIVVFVGTPVKLSLQILAGSSP